MINTYMATIGEQIRTLRQEAGLTQTQAAERLGVTRAALAQWETDRSTPDAQTLGRIADMFGVSMDFLVCRAQDREQTRPSTRNLPALDVEIYPVAPARIELPVVGVIRAGMPILAVQHIEGSEPVDEETYRKYGPDLFYLRVHGDSMEPDHIPDGALVLVKKQEAAEPDDIAVVIVNGDEATLKRVRFADNQAILLSSNPKYLPQVHPAREVQVIGIWLETKIKRRR